MRLSHRSPDGTPYLTYRRDPSSKGRVLSTAKRFPRAARTSLEGCGFMHACFPPCTTREYIPWPCEKQASSLHSRRSFLLARSFIRSSSPGYQEVATGPASPTCHGRDKHSRGMGRITHTRLPSAHTKESAYSLGLSLHPLYSPLPGGAFPRQCPSPSTIGLFLLVSSLQRLTRFVPLARVGEEPR